MNDSCRPIDKASSAYVRGGCLDLCVSFDDSWDEMSEQVTRQELPLFQTTHEGYDSDFKVKGPKNWTFHSVNTYSTFCNMRRTVL